VYAKAREQALEIMKEHDVDILLLQETGNYAGKEMTGEFAIYSARKPYETTTEICYSTERMRRQRQKQVS
jgi:hypothetical protein